MGSLFSITADILWFFLPAIVANMAPVFAARYRWLPYLAVPLDGRHTLRGRRMLGEHKTLRGLVAGVVLGSAVGLWQGSLTASLMLSAGALLGDAVKSMAKRQLDIPPGRLWIPFDQIDFALGALLLGGWFVPVTAAHVVMAPIVLGIGSYAVSHLGVKLGIKENRE
ncbi:MAG: CDP-archaeol synthase [Candidatus Andersenbacteria bacterium]|nr:CDP-archaeol synthase [Candidatus Andersenbacteria bacterium]